MLTGDHRLTFLGRIILPTIPCALENRIGPIGSAGLRIHFIFHHVRSFLALMAADAACPSYPLNRIFSQPTISHLRIRKIHLDKA
jgi:hypothetical protein